MAKLFYGNDDCSIEGAEIRGVEINYQGSVKVSKTCGDNFALVSNESKIMIFPIGNGFLNELFSYNGKLKINSVVVAGNNGQRKRCVSQPALNVHFCSAFDIRILWNQQHVIKR